MNDHYFFQRNKYNLIKLKNILKTAFFMLKSCMVIQQQLKIKNWRLFYNDLDYYKFLCIISKYWEKFLIIETF
jgi:hypothetical protein